MRKKLAIKSSAVGLASKIVTIVCSIIVARYFMRYLGVENNGINGVFSNVIGFLQLAELGIGSAIIYALYEPLIKGDTHEVGILMRFYQRMYRYIGCFIILAGLCLCPFVGVFIKDSSFSRIYLTITFLLQIASSASTYFLSYKRNLMYADQKKYIATAIDASINVISVIIRLFVMVYTQSYVIYLTVQVLQNITSNIIVSLWCNREYPYLRSLPTDKYDKMQELLANVKNLMIGKIGFWVYNSTDNLILSKFTSILLVGIMANFYTLSSTIKLLVNAIVEPIQPMIGHMVREDKKKEEVFEFFLSYTFVRYCIAIFATVGFIEMANPIVTIWIGADYIVNKRIVILMAIDIFICVMDGPTVQFIDILGLFKNNRNMAICAMLINLVSSLVLVQFIGAEGVLLGTVFAQCYYWAARIHTVFGSYFKMGLRQYLLKCSKYAVSTILGIVVLDAILGLSAFGDKTLIVVIEMMAVTIVVTALIVILFSFYTPEFRYTVNLLKTRIIGEKNEED